MRSLVLILLAFGSSAEAAEDPKAVFPRQAAYYDQALLRKDRGWFVRTLDRRYSENLGGGVLLRSTALEVLRQWMIDVDLTACRSKVLGIRKVPAGFLVKVQTSMEGTFHPRGQAPETLKSFGVANQLWVPIGKEWKLRSVWKVSQSTKIGGKAIKP